MALTYKDPRQAAENDELDGLQDGLNGVQMLINAFHERIRDAAQKMSISDYIRLLQVQKELSDDEPRDIEVTWIEKSEDTDLIARLRKIGPNGNFEGMPTGHDDFPYEIEEKMKKNQQETKYDES